MDSTAAAESKSPALNLALKCRDAWNQCIPPFLEKRELSKTSQLCKTLNEDVQPRLDRLKWWTVGEVNWESARVFRVTFPEDLIRPSERHFGVLSRLNDMTQLTHIRGLPALKATLQQAGGEELELTVKLHDCLQELTFADEFNAPIGKDVLPAGLKQLTFGKYFNQSLLNTTLPDGLQLLTFGDDFHQSLPLKLPAKLQQLKFGCFFHGGNLNEVELPEGLQHLTFISDGLFDNVTLPKGLQLVSVANLTAYQRLARRKWKEAASWQLWYL